VGLDRLSIVVLGLGLVLAGCDNGGSPSAARRLLYGEPAQELTAVPGSVIAIGRVFDAATLGRRFTSCSPGGAVNGAVVVERIGVFGESLTFADDAGKTLYSCDGGTDPAGSGTESTKICTNGRCSRCSATPRDVASVPNTS